MRRPAAWPAALVVVGVAYAVLATSWVLAEPPALGFDALLVRSASERLRAGEPLYLDPSGGQFLDPSIEDFYGPPALAVAGLPLTLVSEQAVRLATFPVSWLVFGLGLAALSRRLALGVNQLAGVFLGAMLAFAVFWGATLGASSVWLFGLLAAAAIALDRRSDLVAGLLIGTAAALRIYPVVLLLPLAVGGRWHAVAGSLIAIVGWGLAGIVAAGPEATEAFISLLVTLGGVDAGSSSIALAGLGRVAAVAGGAILLLWSGWRLRSRSGPVDGLLAWSLACAGMLLVTPVAWDHYSTALLPLVVALVGATGVSAAGLLSAGMLPAALAGGFVIVWLPLIGALVAARRWRAPAR